MLNENTTSSALEGELRSLEELDNAVVGHFLDLNQCLIEYRQHGLSGTAIGKRVRELGADISDRSVRRILQDFKMPKPLSDNPEAVRQRKHRASVTNGQIGQMSQTPVENSTPLPAEPEKAPINLSTYVQPEEFIQPERTSEIYNFLSTQLSELNDLIYSNHGQFSDDEYRSLCGTAYHLYINLRTKCDHLERLERNRADSFTVDATQV